MTTFINICKKLREVFTVLYQNAVKL
jgi:hypothetical protein